MNEVLITTLLIVALFALLASGVWIGLTLAGVAWIGMQLFSSRPAGDAMAITVWGSASSWTLTALPLFVWMGEILFRTKLSESMFKGLAPWVNRLPGRLLHTNVIGCTIFAAVSEELTICRRLRAAVRGGISIDAESCSIPSDSSAMRMPASGRRASSMVRIWW